LRRPWRYAAGGDLTGLARRWLDIDRSGLVDSAAAHTIRKINMSTTSIAFIGGGNMASAIIGGLLRQGMSASQLVVVEPFAPQREKLLTDFGVHAQEKAGAALQDAALVVWAVKPQMFKEAASASAAFVSTALQLSVMAGIPTGSMARLLGTERIVRAMPNTPALIGQGITGLYARAAANAQDKVEIERIISTTGELIWVESEAQIDAVTALSGSGPAYVFYFIEAMMRAGQDMGLSAEQARLLAQSTFAGAAKLAQNSSESPATLRERVTSKGGTTYAALTSLQQAQVAQAFEAAMQQAYTRAGELGREFGV
jgi:pyrroline-5-carboxylate reductase